jgi:hypothetical protein
VLIDGHVIEGINRLQRHPPAACGANTLPPDQVPDYVGADSCTDYNGEQPSEEKCAYTLYDADAFDEGLSLWGDMEEDIPLRSARIAKKATSGNIEEVWEPRLAGVPFGPDESGWDASERVVAQIQAFTTPLGEHGFYIPNPCDNFSSERYMVQLLARFFSTQGKDVYYLSHPSSHQCLARAPGNGACPFITP